MWFSEVNFLSVPLGASSACSPGDLLQSLATDRSGLGGVQEQGIHDREEGVPNRRYEVSCAALLYTFLQNMNSYVCSAFFHITKSVQYMIRLECCAIVSNARIV